MEYKYAIKVLKNEIAENRYDIKFIQKHMGYYKNKDLKKLENRITELQSAIKLLESEGKK